MGEERDIPPDMVRHTVRDAADMLGITTGAVRNRLSRGTLQSIKEHGTVYVLLPGDTPRDTERDTVDTPDDIPSETSALLAQLRDEISYLREQLNAEREARTEEGRRADTVIAQLARANEEQARTLGSLEAPRDEQEPPSEAAPRSAGGSVPDEQEEPTRPFWRRWIGR